MQWRVDVLNDLVRQELDALPLDIRAKLSHLEELILQVGLHELREPYVKHLTGKLWEMRMKGKDGIARAIYVTASERRVIIVRAFVKKTQKTPQQEINLALRRAKEI